ncbi:hypothetical protein CEK26_012540 [Fusarium fujikuroi]|nr:hypothetical protein CEK27_012552 [Fusarium fujikuroi]QGI85782.1 hypothetical protein CEK25_012511 [Fusarium fujikuroi]QGI99471.1 hypothetical protein CEK26_012540 [Fusarium fujikuroi]
MDMFSPLLGRQLRFYTRFLALCTTIEAGPVGNIGLSHLSDEILMLIIHNVYEGADKSSLFAFFSLRQVSQQFRRLTQDKAFDSHLFSDKDCCEQCVSSSGVWAGRSASLTNIDLPLTREKHCFGYKAKERGVWLKGLEDLVRKGKTCSTNGLGGPKAEMITYATGGGLLLLTFTGNSDPDLALDQSICDISYGMNYETGTMTLPMRLIEEAIRSVREKGGKYLAPERISGVLPELSGLNLEDVNTDSSS